MEVQLGFSSSIVCLETVLFHSWKFYRRHYCQCHVYEALMKKKKTKKTASKKKTKTNSCSHYGSQKSATGKKVDDFKSI